MSWSFHQPQLQRATPAEAKAIVAEAHLPEPIRAYVTAGIEALEAKHGPNVCVSVSGQGHLCDGPNSYEVTTASIEVKLATT